MNKISLFSLLFTAFGSFAQPLIQDTIILGASYTNEVFYKLNNNTKQNVPAASWHIGFETATMSATVFSNPANTKVYRYPHSTNATMPTTVDTVGLAATWPQLFNSQTTYDGAFNVGGNGSLDYGWGTYSMTTHYVSGDSLYLLNVGNDAYVFNIKNRISGTYIIEYAPLNDLSAVQTISIIGSSYANKNFVFLNLQSGQIVDNEMEGFDLWFRKFHGLYGNYSVQVVTGVLTAPGLQVACVDVGQGNQASYDDVQSAEFSTAINVIGDDWKSVSYTTFQWSVTDSTVYYIKNEAGDIYKLYPTGFTGTSTGIAYFTFQQIAYAGVEKLANTLLDVYPNPTTNSVNIVLDVQGDVSINVRNQMGQSLLVENAVGQVGLTTKQINLDTLPAGMYFIEVISNGHSSVKTVIKK